MQSVETVIKPAEELSLISLYEARLALNLAASTNDTLDDQVEMLVRWASDEISLLCGRDFAQETVVETFRDFTVATQRIFLSHYPVSKIDSITEIGSVLVEGTDYEVDYEAGKLVRLKTSWKEAVVASYTGGYDLPFETPPALQQAAMMITREGYYQIIRGDATVRMISHKDSRVIYFDPNARGGAGGKSGAAVSDGSPARRAINNLLECFIRVEV